MVKVRTPDPSQRWGTFIRNHMDATAACDFFAVPTATFKLIYVFAVLLHVRRRILHVNVTDHPTSAWTARQILEAPPEEVSRLQMRDRDSTHGWEFEQMVKVLGIHQIRSAPRSPWQNAHAERFVRTIKEECLDRMILFGESSLRRALREFVEHYSWVSYCPIRSCG